MTGRRMAMVATAVLAAALLRGGGGDAEARQRQQYLTEPLPNAPYDGRFTFARIRFAPRGGEFFGRMDPKWSHDYPTAEHNFAKIIVELSTMRPYMEGGNVFTLDDPELMKYPIAYLCEPGFWNPTDAEAAGLRAYLEKGGFIMFDDFFGRHWEGFEAAMRRVLPQGRLVRLDGTHPIFDAFYKVEPEEGGGGFGRRGGAEYWGIFEDNDPEKRLLAIVNFNNDIGESWEFSDTGIIPVDVTSVAYKLGMNYLIYGMTH
ncbi:DUF4159 domain-containing protein [Roseisolibacter sp. H3M3-2]|uniref:DUF4159 domain-containing protein n=1 Tax=Roseisolibacter sp. H3M3-2 TaxID=3031323 RepID=UPI0023DBE70A|nr:DUF4159 domain-containing protein [Roseisolibacter sp. H3M3-2]MDF1505007.1 DUF4159 domain-containing protein [Roseisolibacter sp. H3M3-2]